MKVITSLTGRWASYVESYDEEITYDGQVASYRRIVYQKLKNLWTTRRTEGNYFSTIDWNRRMFAYHL